MISESTLSRRERLEAYLSQQSDITSAVLSTQLLAASTRLSVVVPAFQEEKTIPRLLSSLGQQTALGFEVVVVDNGSRDKTREVVWEMAETLNYPLSLLTEGRIGPGNAKKTGADFVLARALSREQGQPSRHYIMFTDADVLVPQSWIERSTAVFDSTGCGAIAGAHTAEPWVDQKIDQFQAISNFFASVANFNLALASRRIGIMKFSGPNSGFELEAYAAAGGMKQPFLSDGRVDLKETSKLAVEVVKLGYPVEPFSATVWSSRRRHLLELIRGKEMYFGSNGSSRFLTIRAEEQVLLDYALEKVPRPGWLRYQNELLLKVFDNMVFQPLRQGQLESASLGALFSPAQSEALAVELFTAPVDEQALPRLRAKWLKEFLNLLEMDQSYG